MPEQSIADRFMVDEIDFRSCFTAPSVKHFLSLLTGWVLTVGRHTLSAVIMTMGLHESHHFATIYRFLARGQWSADHVSYRVFSLLAETFVSERADVTLVVDDTLNRHRGKKICGAAWQHDGAAPKRSKQFSHGVCFVIIGMAVRLPGIADRTFCLPFAARMWWPEGAKVRPQEAPRKTKPQLGLELIELTRAWIEDSHRVRVVGDIGYCCETILKGRPKGVHLTGRVRMDSALYELPHRPAVRGRGRPRKKGPRMPTPATMFLDPALTWSEIQVECYARQCLLKTHLFKAIWYHAAGNEPLTFVLCHDPSGKHADAVFFDTDPEAGAADAIVRYASRFSIEITNRETKQLLGADDPQCRSERSVLRAPLLAYWAYSLVVIWFVRHFSTAKSLVAQVAPWYNRKNVFTFSDMLAAARRSHFTIRFSPEAPSIKESHKKGAARSTRQPEYTRSAKL